MRRPPRALRAVTVTLALAFAVESATPAWAQSPQAGSAAARSTFDAAQKLFDERRYDEALGRFQAAYQASRSPNARLMSARCLAALGRLAEAYDEMAATTREATIRAEREAKYAPTRDAAATELALLERRVGKVAVVIPDLVPGTEVTLGGAPLAPPRLSAPVAVLPGRIELTVRAPGGEVIRRQGTVAAGELQTITVTLSKREAPAAPPAPAPAGVGPVRVAGIVIAGVGVIGMGVFAGAGLSANAKASQLDAACGGTRCKDPMYASTVSAGRTLDLVANVGLSVGLVGLVGGALMIALGGAAHPPAALEPKLTRSGLSFAF